MATNLGNWQEAIDSLVKNIEKKADWKEFESLDTDERRVKYILSSRVLKKIDWLKVYFDSCQSFHQKSHEKSVEFKIRGNEFFKKKEYKEAVRFYTESVVYAPVTDSDDLSVAYGNRSAALFFLGLYKDCLEDIKNAVEAGYCDSVKYKLEIRRCNCFFHLDQLQPALIEVGKLKKSLEVKKLDFDKTKFKNILKDLDVLERNILERQKLKVSTESYSLSTEDNLRAPPHVSYKQSDVLKQASSCLQLNYNQEKGRFITASEDIKAGNTLMIEEPYSSVLLPDQYNLYCHHCFNTLPLTSIGCKRCSSVRYCNKICQEKSWHTYHHVECYYLNLLHSVGIAHLSLRIVLTAGLQFLLEFVAKRRSMTCDLKMNGRDKDGCYHGEYLSVFDLLTHSDHMISSDLYQYSLTASLLLLILIHSGWFHNNTDGRNSLDGHHHINKHDGRKPEGHRHSNKDGKDGGELYNIENRHGVAATLSVDESESERIFRNILDDHDAVFKETVRTTVESDDLEMREATGVTKDMSCIGGLLLRHILQLVCNAHAITDLQMSYSTSHVEDMSQIRVATAIYPTASLMNHSCDPSIISSFHGNNLIVRAVKDVKIGDEIFNCYGPHYRRMPRRERQEILKTQYFFTCSCSWCIKDGNNDFQFDAVVCGRCSGFIDTLLQKPSCLQCGETERLEDKNKRDEILQLFYQATDLINSSHFEDAVRKLKRCLKLCQKYLHGNNRLTAGVHDNLARCYSIMGNFKVALCHLEKSMAVTLLMYGENSVEVGHELQKMADILFQCRDCKRCLQVVERALDIFNTLYGESHPVVAELKEMKSHIVIFIGNS